MGFDDREFAEILAARAERMQQPKLISVGRGVVDAREIVAVIDLLDGDHSGVLESGETVPHPAYARSRVLMRQTTILADEPASVIVMRWRQALGGLPEPVGSTTTTDAE